MRRILMAMTVAAIMAAMTVVGAGSASASTLSDFLTLQKQATTDLTKTATDANNNMQTAANDFNKTATQAAQQQQTDAQNLANALFGT